MSDLPLVSNQVQFLRFTVTTPGTAQQFTDVTIPDGFETTFKNRADNTGSFYLAPTQAAAQSSTGARKILTSGESVTLAIDNLNRLWRDCDDSTSVLEVTVLAPALTP